VEALERLLADDVNEADGRRVRIGRRRGRLAVMRARLLPVLPVVGALLAATACSSGSDG
jgi:hypothetical protein